MKPRGGRLFCPGVASLIGTDVLEIRQLLSGVADLAMGTERPAAIAPVVDATRSNPTEASSSGQGETPAESAALTVDPSKSSDGSTNVEPGAEDAILPVPPSPDYGAPDESPASSPGDPPESLSAGAIGTIAAIGGVQPTPTAMAVLIPRAARHSGANRVEAGTLDGASSRPSSVVPMNVEFWAEDGALLLDVGAGAGLEPHRWLAAYDPDESSSNPIEEATASNKVSEPISHNPVAADLITEFLPFDRNALDAAIDRFATPLDELGTNLAGWAFRWDAASGTMLVLATALAIEVARRRLRDGGPLSTSESHDEELVRFPGHPSTWGLGES